MYKDVGKHLQETHRWTISASTLGSKKTCEISGTLITKSIGHWQMLLFPHLTYFVQLLYLGKLSDLNISN